MQNSPMVKIAGLCLLSSRALRVLPYAQQRITWNFQAWVADNAAWLCRAVASGGAMRKTSPGDVFLLSALAKLGATVVTYPLLLVKARLQSAGKHTSQDRRYTGTIDAIEKIYKTEGAFCFIVCFLANSDARSSLLTCCLQWGADSHLPSQTEVGSRISLP